MEEIIIAKTILTILPTIDAIRDSIFNKNYFYAVHSMNDVYDTYGIAERILENISRSEELWDLKENALEQIDAMPEKLGCIIKLRFFEKRVVEQIAEKMGISARTIFRLSDEAVRCFAGSLGKIGLDNLGFMKLIKRNKWIKDEYKHQELLVKCSSRSSVRQV